MPLGVMREPPPTGTSALAWRAFFYGKRYRMSSTYRNSHTTPLPYRCLCIVTELVLMKVLVIDPIKKATSTDSNTLKPQTIPLLIIHWVPVIVL